MAFHIRSHWTDGFHGRLQLFGRHAECGGPIADIVLVAQVDAGPIGRSPPCRIIGRPRHSIRRRRAGRVAFSADADAGTQYLLRGLATGERDHQREQPALDAFILDLQERRR